MWIDKNIFYCHQQKLAVKAFQPKESVLVLGRSNQQEKEIYADIAASDQVAILRRAGGGGAVLLHDGCLIVSISAGVKDYFNNSSYFKKLNKSVITFLHNHLRLGGPLTEAGISDIAYGDKKVAGTSLFRSRNYLLYQASVLIDSRIELIEKYLKHPSKEPDYRKHRQHRQFLVGLQELDQTASLGQLVSEAESELLLHLNKNLAEDLIEPVTDQFQHLAKKFASTP